MNFYRIEYLIIAKSIGFVIFLHTGYICLWFLYLNLKQ